MPGSIGPMEIGIVLIIALVVFGPKKLPELGKSLGSGIREFKGSIGGIGGGGEPEAAEAPRQVGAAPAAAAQTTGPADDRG